MSLWLWLCILDDDLLLLPVLSVILKMYEVPFFILLPSHLTIFSLWRSKNVTCVKFISLHHMRTMLVVAKRVTWTLLPSRPRKTGSRHNDTLCWVGKPKWSVTMSQKQLSHSFPYYAIFDKNRTGGSFHAPPPVAGIRVKIPGLFTNYSYYRATINTGNWMS